MIAPAVNGWDKSLNARLPYDSNAAKKLLAEAGYPNGFTVGMNCPNTTATSTMSRSARQ